MKLTLLLALCACGHSDSKPSEGSAAVAPKAMAKEVVMPATVAAADQKATKVLAIDALGLEVDAPACAEVTAIDKDDQSITPKDPSCSVPFPGAVISRGAMMSALPSLDDQLKGVKALAANADITVKEKTATGYHIEFKTPAANGSPEQANLQVYAKIGDTAYTCIGSGSYDAGKLAVLSSICTSLRAKH